MQLSLVMQDAATQLLTFVSNDAFMNLLVNVQTYLVHVKVLTSSFLKSFPSAIAAVDHLKRRDSQGCISEETYTLFTSSLTRVQRIFRFIACVLAMNPPFLNTTLSAHDVAWLVTYKGREHLERSLHEVISASDFWQRECDDCIRCSSTTTQLKPQMERLLETFNAFNDGVLTATPDRLEEAVGILTDVKKGMRKADLQAVDEVVTTVLIALGRSILDGTTESAAARTRFVTSLLNGLSLYSDIGGTSDLQMSLRQWMTSNGPKIALFDLVDLAQTTEKNGGAADVLQVQALMAKLKSVKELHSDEQSWAATSLLGATFRSVLTEAIQTGKGT